MHLQLGQHGFDITTRALVVASVAADAEPSDQLATESPGAIEIVADAADNAQLAQAMGSIAEMFDCPVGVRTSDAAVAEHCTRTGASFLHDATGLADPAYLRAVESSQAGLIISTPPTVDNEPSFLAERAGWAEAAGIARNRIVLRCAPEVVQAVLQFGCAVMVEPPDDLSAPGVSAVAVTNGARLIRSNQVRSTRRTIDTVSELLERREPAGVN